jgi:hypothetical protein
MSHNLVPDALPRGPVQTITFDDRALRVTIAAQPYFVSKRRTTLPAFVLAFALVAVGITSALFGTCPTHWCERCGGSLQL